MHPNEKQTNIIIVLIIVIVVLTYLWMECVFLPRLMIVCIVLDDIDNNCILYRNKALLFLLIYHIQCN